MIRWRRVNNIPNDLYSEFQLSLFNLKVQRTLVSLKSWLELRRTLEVPDWGFCQQCPRRLIFHSLTFYIVFKGKKNPDVLEVLFGDVEDTGGSRLKFWFLNMIGMGHPHTKTRMFKI